MKKLIIIIVIIGIGIMSYQVINKSNQETRGMFSWYRSEFTNKELFSTLKNNHTSEIYQLFDHQCSDKEVIQFVNNAHKNHIDVYALAGEKEWATDASAKDVLSEIQHIQRYNTLLKDDDKIKGIVLDIEPYTLSNWRQHPKEILDTYTQVLRKCYKNKKNLKLYICIPFYLDDLGYKTYLTQWAKNCCDGFFVMNYSKGHEIKNIETEVKICTAYKKRLVTIYELNKPGAGIEKSNTYYGSSLNTVDDNYEKLKKHYQYSKISEAYHDYKAFKQMKDIK